MRKQTFGEIIQEARTSRRLTQSQVAKAIESHVSLISEWERDKAEPNARVIVKLAKFLRLDALRLLEAGHSDFKLWEKAFGQQAREIR